MNPDIMEYGLHLSETAINSGNKTIHSSYIVLTTVLLAV